ncbi:MAG: TlpA disulfide reductase family protein [Gemmatimonadota bacterium]
MNRAALVAAAALAAAAAGCGDRGGGQEVQGTRVAAVRARPGALDPRSWCDTYYPADTAPAYRPPDLAPARGPGPAPAMAGGRWVWINFWATWCGPCRREMPMLEEWRAQLVQAGVPVDLWYVSLDESPDDLQRFLRQNPRTAPDPSWRLTAPDQLGRWIQQWSPAGAAGIPVHVMVDPQRRVRCIHVGETREGDYPFVRALFE